MVQYISFSNGRLVFQDEYSEGIWINIVPPHQKEDLEELSEKFQIPLDFLTDPLDIEERARYEREDDIRLIILSIPYKQSDEDHSLYSTIPLGIILTPLDLITISPKENIIVSRFVEERVKNFSLTNREYFVLKIMDQTSLWFLEYLKRLNLKRNLLEQELYNSSRNQELKELLKIEKSLVYFLNSLKADELLLMKMNRTDFLKIRENEDHVDYFEDIIVDYSQGLDMANVHTNILSGIMDTYATIISNNFNNLIQRLTFVTVILQVPTLIASFYGMNIKLPFSDFKYMFYVLLTLSFALGITLVYFLIKRIRT
ncbi:MAG: magnesium transporter CorA family protein [Saprospiraceae bacterium]|nr:magnesium transporter CorA family protein [Saprospiraceae bacterium]